MMLQITLYVCSYSLEHQISVATIFYSTHYWMKAEMEDMIQCKYSGSFCTALSPYLSFILLFLSHYEQWLLSTRI